MYGTFWALVPPVIAIVLALITKEAYSSLFIGVVIGALFGAEFSFSGTLDRIVNDGFLSAISENAGIFLFLVLLGIIVSLINASGASAAFGRWADKSIKTRVGAMLATYILGLLLFIDDYFNCLTVGSVMRPVTDRRRVSRAKFSYLLDSVAAPVCMIAPVSTWAAAVSGVISETDTGYSGIGLFIRTVPYNFYSLLTIVFVITLILMKFDFGPMKQREYDAVVKGELGKAEGTDAAPENPKGKMIDLVLPVIVLILSCTAGMLYVGGFFGADPAGNTAFAWDFAGAIGNTDAFVGLPWGAIPALVFTIVYLLLRRVISFKNAMSSVPKGFQSMLAPILILTLAVSLKNMTVTLGAEVFVRSLMEGAASVLYNLLPAIIFLLSAALAFASGTSWGTFGILIPIISAIFPASGELIVIGVSACLAGAVCGDQCSPISDTTIMSSAGAQVNHLEHVRTQLPYATTVATICFFSYIFAGFVQNAAVSLAFGAALTVGTLFAIRSTETGKQPGRQG